MKHTLKADGAPFSLDGTPVNDNKSTAGGGRAQCACGWQSGILSSRAARKMAFNTHKIAPGKSPEPDPAPDAEPEIETEVEAAVEAPAPESQKEGHMAKEKLVEFTKEHGAKRFAPAMIDAATVAVVHEGLELEATSEGITITGGDVKARNAAAKAVEAFWLASYVAFKEWKKENKERRKDQWASNEGKREMFAEELQFFRDYAGTYATGADVL